MELKKYVPIGTVVKLKDASKRVMVTGFCCSSDEDKDKMFDYCGCLYPEGQMSSKNTLLFDHEQIDKVYYVGLSDQEEKEFKEKLERILDNLKS